jgi:G3E family GTPase
VQYPLRRLYDDNYRIAPLSVLVDPMRAARMLGLEQGHVFSPKVQYIYEKQLEEADIIVINKSDLVGPERAAALAAALKARFPQADVVTVSARTGAGLRGWYDRLSGTLAERAAMDVDYDLYAEGEALLGWLNATCRVSEAEPFDGNRLLQRLAERVHRDLAAAAIEIAHFKMTLVPDEGNDLAVMNLVRTDGGAESAHHLADDLTAGELIVNLRAEGDPSQLREVATSALEAVARESNVRVVIEHIEDFRPGRPQPTHRMALP